MLSPADQKFLFKRRKFNKFLPPVVPYTVTGLCIALALFSFFVFTKLESDAKLVNKEYLKKIESIEVYSELEKNLQSSLVQEIKDEEILLTLIPEIKGLLVVSFLILGFLSLEYYRNDRRLMQIINKLEENKSL